MKPYVIAFIMAFVSIFFAIRYFPFFKDVDTRRIEIQNDSLDKQNATLQLRFDSLQLQIQEADTVISLLTKRLDNLHDQRNLVKTTHEKNRAVIMLATDTDLVNILTNQVPDSLY
jgi:hypothetical protein